MERKEQKFNFELLFRLKVITSGICFKTILRL